MQKRWIVLGLLLVAVVAVGVTLAFTVFKKDEEEVEPEVLRGRDVLDIVPLIDGHNDFPFNLYELESNQIEDFEFDSDLRNNSKWNGSSTSFTDLPRLREGKVGGQFWVAYVSCDRNNKDAAERTLEQIDVIKRLIRKYPNDMQYVTNADDIMKAYKEKKIASMIEIEGGHSIDSRLSVLRLYYELGVRVMTMTHSCNLPWADASPIDDVGVGAEPPVKRNLTDWGLKVVDEMNRLGMIIDISHVSEGVMEAALDRSKASLIFSHSSVFNLCNHHRNVKDHVLRKLKEKNGLIMINFYTSFICGNKIEDVISEYLEIISRVSESIFNFLLFFQEHINYVRDLIGSEHVGIGGDYDGIESAPSGLDDVSKFPDLFDKLFEGGDDFEPWTKDELKNLAGLNLIRVFKDVERVRDELKDQKIIDDPVPYDDLIQNNPNIATCRTDVNKYRPSMTESKILRTLMSGQIIEEL